MEKFTTTITVAIDAPAGQTEKIRAALSVSINTYLRDNMEQIAAHFNGELENYDFSVTEGYNTSLSHQLSK